MENYKVLLADDEAEIRTGISRKIDWFALGFTLVGEAANGEEALELAEQLRPDVVLTDIKMPFMNGLELCRRLRMSLPGAGLVVFSGFNDFEYARRAIDIGVERFLLKPVTKNTLIGVLGELKEKIEGSNYLAQFHHDAQEYEQFARRRFFEQVVGGQLTVQQIYEEAAKLDLDLRAQCYTIALFSILPSSFPNFWYYFCAK